MLLQPGGQQRMHWAAEMALRLLQQRHAAQQHSSSSSSSGSSSSGGSFWQCWIDSLPQAVVTPVEFTADEVQALVLPGTIQVSALLACYTRLTVHLLVHVE
jgi:hypothetical protein